MSLSYEVIFGVVAAAFSIIETTIKWSVRLRATRSPAASIGRLAEGAVNWRGHRSNFLDRPMFGTAEDQSMNESKKMQSDDDIEIRGETDGKAAELLKGGLFPTGRPHPPPEEDLGGGDICSPEPSADDGAM